jgi:hypothetical protein
MMIGLLRDLKIIQMSYLCEKELWNLQEGIFLRVTQGQQRSVLVACSFI